MKIFLKIYRTLYRLIFILNFKKKKKRKKENIWNILISVDVSFAKDSVKIFIRGECSCHVGGAKTKQFLDPRYEFLSSLDAKLDPAHTLKWTVKKIYDIVILFRRCITTIKSIQIIILIGMYH